MIINYFINPNVFIYQSIKETFKNNIIKINKKTEELNTLYESLKTINPEFTIKIEDLGNNEIKNLKELYVKEEEKKNISNLMIMLRRIKKIKKIIKNI